MLLPLTVFLLAGSGPVAPDRAGALNVPAVDQSANALVDYERAGDLLKDPAFRVFQKWLPPEKRPTPEQIRQAEDARQRMLASMTPQERRGAEQESEQLSPEDLELAAHLNGLSYLATRQEEVERFQLPLDLLERGIREPFVYVPAASEKDVRGQLEVVGAVGRLVRLASDAAFVSFAAGQSGRAVNVLDDALIMCQRLGQCGIPARQASANLCALLFRTLNDNLGSLTLDDAKKLADTSEGLLADRSALAGLVKNEKLRLSRWIDQVFGPDGAGSLGRQGDGSLAQQYVALSPDLRVEFLKKLHSLADERLDSLGKRFDSPEENWLAVSEPAPVQPPDPKSLDELEAALARAFTSGIDHRFMLALVRSRTQTRLLDLHARIVLFRWQTGRLPATLDELRLPRDSVYDPLSRRLFNYERSDTSYKLWSSGIQETGPIELKYQPPADQSAHDPDRP